VNASKEEGRESLGANKIPSQCKRCKNKSHSEQLDTVFCKKRFEFKEECSDFELDRVRENFQNLCSRVMTRRTNNNGWSDWEKEVKKGVLIPCGLKEGRDYIHNFRIQNEKKTGYFELDFFLFKLRGIIEADGGAWHSAMGHGTEKDVRRDKWFKKLGYPTFRVRSREDFPGAIRFIRTLRDVA